MIHQTLADAVTRGRGRERAFRCPVHEDRVASASVNVLKGKWVCYTCGAHGTTENIIEPDDIWFSRDIEELLDDEIRIYSESWLTQFSHQVHPYWLSRFCQDACHVFELGYDHIAEAPCYPMRGPNGEIWGLVHRNLSNEGPKYHYPYGPKKSQTLFHYTSDQRDIVYLCEGAMDVVACWEANVDAFGIYGAQLSKTQLRLIGRCQPSRIALLLDNDRAGLAATEMIGNRLCALGYDVVVPDWDAGVKDIAELSVQLRRTLLAPLALMPTL